MKEKLDLYIKENLEEEITKSFKHNNLFSYQNSESKDKSLNYDYDNIYTNDVLEIPKSYRSHLSSDIDKYIESHKENYNDFQTTLFKIIDEKKLKDSDVYNKVHIDRRLFSKIRSDRNYHPSKETVLLLGFSLELNEEEIIKLLDSASYSLPKNNYYDLIIRFCFINQIYKLKDVNNLLDMYNCKLFNY